MRSASTRPAFGRGARVAFVAVGLVAAIFASPGTALGSSGAGPDYNADGYADLAVGVAGEQINGHISAGAVQVIYGTADGLNGDYPIDDQLWSQDSAGIAGVAESGDIFGASLAAGDFNDDGFDDLAIGVPGESLGSIGSAGAVQILYGSRYGLRASGSILLTQDASGIAGTAGSGDRFGSALEAANFGKGSADDLAIGVPFDDSKSGSDAGAVNVVYGSAQGLTANGNQLWHQNADGIPDLAETGDHFGWSLAAANFGRSRKADLAVGVPDEDVGVASRAGAVNVIYGSRGGLNATGAQIWTQDSAGVVGYAEAYDQFGLAVAASDFGDGSFADLAIGVPGEDIGAVDAGAVNVIYGGDSGLRAADNEVWYQGTTGIAGDPEAGDQFGKALAAADFGKGSQADLAIGVPGEDQEDATPDDDDTGAVNVIYGSAYGLAVPGNQFWWQDSAGIEGETENGDAFGSALAVGNYGRDAANDLAVGVPGEAVEDWTIAIPDGAVNVIYGTSSGLSEAGDQFWWQASDTLKGSADDFDTFGSALAD